MGSSDFSLSLKIEFYQTPGKNEQEDEKKEKHNDLKGEEEHVSDGSGRELLGIIAPKTRGPFLFVSSIFILLVAV